MNAVSPRVLIAPLDWGIGHATRDIPVIYELLNHGVKVMIGSDGPALALLKKEFPALEFIRIPSYGVKYPAGSSMTWKMSWQLPKFFHAILREHLLLKKIIRSYHIDAVISDNRYGMWNKSIPSVFITHQLQISTPSHLIFLKPLLFAINRFFISRFDSCWVPDIPDENNLGGELSHPGKKTGNTTYIGPVSRFANKEWAELQIPPNGGTTNEPYDIAVLLSGPEPQRTILERIILGKLEKTNYRTVVLRGLPEQNVEDAVTAKMGGTVPRKAGSVLWRTNSAHRKMEIHNHLESEVLLKKILQSKTIIARAGYSTIMDLAALGKNAILIPTPGQTEQEYLAKHLKERKIFYSVPQENFNLEDALKQATDFKGIKMENINGLLKGTIAEWCRGLG